MGVNIPHYEKDLSDRHFETIAEAKFWFIHHTIKSHADDGEALMSRKVESDNLKIMEYVSDLSRALYGENYSDEQAAMVYGSVHTALWLAAKLKYGDDRHIRVLYTIPIAEPETLRVDLEREAEGYWAIAPTFRGLIKTTLPTITPHQELYGDAEMIMGCTFRGIDE